MPMPRGPALRARSLYDTGDDSPRWVFVHSGEVLNVVQVKREYAQAHPLQVSSRQSLSLHPTSRSTGATPRAGRWFTWDVRLWTGNSAAQERVEERTW